MGDHAAARNPQAQFEAIVGDLLGRATASVCLWLKTTFTPAPRIGTDGDGQGVNDLHLFSFLPKAAHQLLLNALFDPPQVRRLAHKEAAFGQLRKEMAIMAGKVAIGRLIGVEAKALAAHFQRDPLGIAKRWGEACFADTVLGCDLIVFVTNQTVHSDDKIIPIH